MAQHHTTKTSVHNSQLAIAQPSAGLDKKSEMIKPNESRSPTVIKPALPFITFNPDAYGKPCRLRGGSHGPTRRRGSTTVSAPLKNLPTPKNGVNLPDVDQKHVSSGIEASADTTALSSPAVLPEDASITNPKRGNLSQTKSLAEQKGVSASASPRKGKDVMEENQKPSKACVTNITAIITNETMEQKLARLQKAEITKLGHKIRHHQGSESTTSLQVLRIARQSGKNLLSAEVIPETPMTTTNALSPTTTDDEKVGGAQMDGSDVQVMEQRSQQVPQDNSLRSPTISPSSKLGGHSYNGRGARWAISAETKPTTAPTKSIDSNAFGSEVPSDAGTASGDSVAAMENGRLLKMNRPACPDSPLAGWSGNWMSPAMDSDAKPPFNNDSAPSFGEFGQWNETTATRSLNVATGIPFTCLPVELVKNPDLHPDGLDLVDPTMNVDVDTAQRYGYDNAEVLATIKQDSQLIDPSIFTNDWGKLDMQDPENAKFCDECCKDLVHNYNANMARERNEHISSIRAQNLARRRATPINPAPNPHAPHINIYLRPAGRSDIPQMRTIYNSYVNNSARTAEIYPITDSDMLNRWTDSTDEKLPFIVAVSKSAKPNRGASNKVEKIVGWACATDWVNRHAVERFTVELEIYVHPQYTRQGVGKCLMDKLIDSTDRGHIARKGCPFNCAPEVRHGYSAGGARDLMKLLILVRSLDKPASDRERDLPWIKKWLEEEWNFEQQGHFPKTGVKFKRYVNQTIFVRSTSYNPKEFMIPEGPQ